MIEVVIDCDEPSGAGHLAREPQIDLCARPGEVIHAAGGSQMPLLFVAAQAGGALYLGFAILNWMAKYDIVGGIYNRPVATGKFLVINEFTGVLKDLL